MLIITRESSKIDYQFTKKENSFTGLVPFRKRRIYPLSRLFLSERTSQTCVLVRSFCFSPQTQKKGRKGFGDRKNKFWHQRGLFPSHLGSTGLPGPLPKLEFLARFRLVRSWIFFWRLVFVIPFLTCLFLVLLCYQSTVLTSFLNSFFESNTSCS